MPRLRSGHQKTVASVLGSVLALVEASRRVRAALSGGPRAENWLWPAASKGLRSARPPARWAMLWCLQSPQHLDCSFSETLSQEQPAQLHADF